MELSADRALRALIHQRLRNFELHGAGAHRHHATAVTVAIYVTRSGFVITPVVV